MKRRKFLSISIGTTALTIFGASGCSLFNSSQPTRDLSLYGLDQSQPGQINQKVLDILGATVLTLTAPKTVDLGHYEDFFQWHAENVSGHRAIYGKFAESMQNEASRAGTIAFTDLSPEAQLKIINRYRPGSQLNGIQGLRSAFDASLKEKQNLYESFVFGDILRVFQRTDALKLVGYDHWFGVPRGLDSYRNKLSAQAF